MPPDMPKEQLNTEKRGPGRPKKVFTPEEISQIEDMARIQCSTRTIAECLGVSEEQIRQRADITAIVKRKRAYGRMILHKTQHEMAEKQVVMAIWLGKQHLEQADKADITSGGESVADFMALLGSRRVK